MTGRPHRLSYATIKAVAGEPAILLPRLRGKELEKEAVQTTTRCSGMARRAR